MRSFYKLAIVFLVILHVISILSNVNLSGGIFLAGIFVGFFGLNVMSKGFQRVTMLFFILGIGGLWWYHQSLSVWMESFNNMTNFIAILVQRTRNN